MRIIQLILLTVLFVKSSFAEAIRSSDLRLEPMTKCRGAGRPAPKTKETIRTESVGVPATGIDLNGDGWCDWIIFVPAPINTQLPEYMAKEAILLGGKRGAKPFGKLDKMRDYQRKQLPIPSGLVIPEGIVGMAPPLVAYLTRSATPYFMGISTAFPYFWSDAESYSIYRWNNEFDMPQQVSDIEFVTVLEFWRQKFCIDKKYSNAEYLHPDLLNPEHPLEVLVCAPWMSEVLGAAKQRVERK
ncbi:hypothetical protein [Noviherbaspirillum galbum]|uniref:Uncharacterized protein n=1 Tax=Noviherbaspirillum galbum TaxID=2709383 RepID=A0A6B3SUA4_9BURK|nr:hypothetical protein [Noviherbaspirillum galbum]NEX62456.1 hypothetical protein [Noviherbaspirillum galbum]